MTKKQIAIQLLKHGPLSLAQFVEITGWTYSECRRVLSYLVDDLGEVSRNGGVYEVAG